MTFLNFHHALRCFLRFSAFLFAACLGTSPSYAAPHPGMGSSLLVSPEKGLFWKRYGFQLQTGNTGWQLASPADDSSTKVRYLRPSSDSASLAVQIESLKADLTLENYAKKWMRDYVSYGFDVLGTQAFVQNNAKGLVIDLIHKKSDQQLRQILFLKNKKVVVLTCRDHQKTFVQTIQGCNQISKSFEWSADLNRQITF